MRIEPVRGSTIWKRQGQQGIARDSRSRDKAKRQACTHTDGQQGHQKDGGVDMGGRRNGKEREGTAEMSPFPSLWTQK